MISRAYQFNAKQNPEYLLLRQPHIELIFDIAHKLRISNNSSHLASYLLDVVMFADPTLTIDLPLYAPTCLLIASKTIELDERIPFIPKLRRYANPTYTVEDYVRAEYKILDIVDWNPQYTSILELMEFFLAQGIIFSTDNLESEEPQQQKVVAVSQPNVNSPSRNTRPLGENTQHGNIGEQRSEEKRPQMSLSKENIEVDHGVKQKSPVNKLSSGVIGGFIEQDTSKYSSSKSFEKAVEPYIAYYESKYIRLSNNLVRDSEFVKWEPKILAAAGVAFLRSMSKISPIWNKELERISLLRFDEISECYEAILAKYEKNFNFVRETKPSLYSVGSQDGYIPEIKLFKNGGSVNDPSESNNVNSEGQNNENNLPQKNENSNENQVKLGDNKAFENNLNLQNANALKESNGRRTF